MDGGQDGLPGELIFEQTLRKSHHVKIRGGEKKQQRVESPSYRPSLAYLRNRKKASVAGVEVMRESGWR